MKTSVIEVHDMLTVFSVDEVEKRIGEVPGVGSVTVNHAAGNATVRFDETRLEIADIKSAVRQRGFDSTAAGASNSPASAPPTKGGGHEGHASPEAPIAAASPAASKQPLAPPPAPSGASKGPVEKDKSTPGTAPETPETDLKKSK